MKSAGHRLTDSLVTDAQNDVIDHEHDVVNQQLLDMNDVMGHLLRSLDTSVEGDTSRDCLVDHSLDFPLHAVLLVRATMLARSAEELERVEWMCVASGECEPQVDVMIHDSDGCDAALVEMNARYRMDGAIDPRVKREASHI